MSITTKELKALLQKSGNRCAFPECGELLLYTDKENIDEKTILSNIAHIVAQSEDGPRGKYPLPITERDNESNLLLLCERHHKIIDDQPQRYTVERLRQFKEDHERKIEDATARLITRKTERREWYRETLYSTLFEVVEMPAQVYFAPSKFSQTQATEIRTKIVSPRDSSELYPYIIRDGNLYTFQNLRYARGPFQHIVDLNKTNSIRSYDFWNDPVKNLWFIELLNRSINKLTGRKGLLWDREHKRYYFQPDQPGKVKEIEYRPLNQAKSKKQVAWQPISQLTHQPRPYWLHRAVNIRFHKVTPTQWCVSVRPEFRVTKDGVEPIESERIGATVTRKKSRMFNYDLLGEVNFWRDFLSDSEPRIILNFGKGQHLIISTSNSQFET